MFILVTWVWGNLMDKNISILSLLWEYRTALFTSIVVVLFSNTAKGIEKYKDAMWFRWKYYYELMDLFYDFFSCLYSQVTNKKMQSTIFLSRKQFDVFVKEIDRGVQLNDELHQYLDKIKKLFVEIKSDKKYDIVYSFDGASFDHVNICMKRILSLDDDEILNHLTLFFDLINNFGWIWRKDTKTRIKIDKILYGKYSFEGYNDDFLCEVYGCKEINNNPY